MAQNGVSFQMNFASQIQRMSNLFEAKPEQITKAANRAMRKTTQWLRTRIAREVGQSMGIPQAVLKKRLTLSTAGTGEDKVHILWFGTNPIAAERLKPRQTKKGVTAGKRKYPGAFYKKVFGTEPRVWIRKSRALDLGLDIPNLDRDSRASINGRFPVLGITITFDVGVEIFRRYQNRAEERFATLMEQELNYVINVEGSR